MFEQLKNLNLDRMELDEAIGLYAYGKHLQGTYAEFSIDPPSWLTINLKSLSREIQSRDADRKEKLLSELRSRRDALRTPDEKRKELDEKIAALEAAASA